MSCERCPRLRAHCRAVAREKKREFREWTYRGKPMIWKNRVPQVIVDAFEAEGFIWGGRWKHYDTMHFEYRPELISPACR